VGGLNEGSPVVFRGVKIGSVKDIVLRADSEKLTFTIPVYIEIEPAKFTVTGPHPKKLGENLKAFIDKGLRATLEMQSIVTGQMQVGLDFYPDKPAKFVAMDPTTPEVPTIPTPMQELAKKIQNLPIDQIFEKLRSTLDSIDKVASSPEIPEAIRSVNLALGDVRKLVKNVDGQVGPLLSNLNETVKDVQGLVQNADAKLTGLASNLDETVKDVRGLVQNADAKMTGLASNLDGAVTDVRGLVKNVDNSIEPVFASIEGTLKSVDATLIVAQESMDSIEGATGEDSPMIYEMNRTLEEIQALARSIRVLVDHLERRPESLIRGK
jgi:paraquat-inducible protein B